MVRLSQAQEMTRNAVRQIARERIAPRSAENDEQEEFPHDIIQVLAEAGLLRIGIPKEYGGVETDCTTMAIVVEELAKAEPGVASIVTTHMAACKVLGFHTSDEVKRECYGRLTATNGVGAMLMTEPEAGSDVASIQTRAVPDGDFYVLSGTKRFGTNSTVAEVYLVYAVTQPGQGTKGISCFIVPKGTPGLKTGPKEKKMGQHGSPVCDVILDEVRLPRENLIGAEGQGFKIMMMTTDEARTRTGAVALGIAEAAFDYAVKYAKERIVFGQPVATFQGIQWMLADMAMQIEAARALLNDVVSRMDTGESDMTCLAAMVKCLCSDMAMRVTTDALQVLGGYGYMHAYPLEKLMRDTKVTQIYSGTNQIQRMVIARHILS